MTTNLLPNQARPCHGFDTPYYLLSVVILLLLLLSTARVQAYPEFQMYAQKQAGRPVDCEMCHRNATGPIGSSLGQIGSLNDEEMARLNESRAAAMHGNAIDNPILNAFGNKIVYTVGMKRIFAFRNNPAALAQALDPESDLDGDSIPDVKEFLAGTDPLDKSSGNPVRLFLVNLAANKKDIFTMLIGIVFSLVGLRALLQGYERKAAAERIAGDGGAESLPGAAGEEPVHVDWDAIDLLVPAGETVLTANTIEIVRQDYAT